MIYGCNDTRLTGGTNPKECHIDGYKYIRNNAKYIDFIEEWDDPEGVYSSPSSNNKAIKQLNAWIPEEKKT